MGVAPFRFPRRQQRLCPKRIHPVAWVWLVLAAQPLGSWFFELGSESHEYMCFPGRQPGFASQTCSYMGPCEHFWANGCEHCFLLALPDGLVSLGCRNKLLETEAETIEMYFLMVLEVRDLKSRCWRDWFLLRILRENPFSSGFQWLQKPLAFFGLYMHHPISTSVIMQLSSVSLGLNSSSFLL